MLQHAPDARTAPASAPPAFSLVCGGLLFCVCRRAHVSGEALEFLNRRVLALALFAWLPLLALSIVDGVAFSGGIRIPFASDVETHVRFLLALPLFIVAEVFVDARISPLVGRFLNRGIIRPADVPAFKAAVAATHRARDSFAVEGALLVLVYTLGLWVWRSTFAPQAGTWYAHVVGTTLQLGWAGYWYIFVSIPLLQFILLRWYLRLALWFRLLWRISRLDLRLTAAHPDGAGGIGFLGVSAYAYSPVLFAQGVMVAGVMATRILYEGKTLEAFTTEAGSLVGAMVLVVLGPLVMFWPQLDRARRKGSAVYGRLANQYIFDFEDKWFRHGAPRASTLLGTSDLQSLADLGVSHQVVKDMRLLPFSKRDVLEVALATVAPLLPLALTTFSAEELIRRVFRLFFP